MQTLTPETSDVLVIDFQAKLMPLIHNGDAVVQNASRLIKTARLLGLRLTYTEQNPQGLGQTLPSLAPNPDEVMHKMTFDAMRAPAFAQHMSRANAIVVMGCETHVCVLQTVFGLLNAGRLVFVVADAVGSRTPENRQAALDRMSRRGAQIVTTEMVIFEWLETSEHPSFRDIVKLVK